MLPNRSRFFGLAVALMLLAGGRADAAPADGLAARAVAEATSMPAGRERDVTLREISRNLRYADRDRAIDAAAAMSEDYELRTFGPGEPTQRIVPRDDDRACERFVEQLKPASATAADDRHIRDCFAMDAPPGIVAPPLPPFRLILKAADALAPGPTRAELLYMATWDAVPERPAGGAAEAVRRLRALVPLLRGDTRRQAIGWLDTVAVDLIEGRPDDAVARIRRALASGPSATAALGDEPATRAQGLVADLLRASDFDRAVAVTDLLPPSTDCAMVDDGLTGVLEWVLPGQDGAVVATYMARLQASGSLARLCPNGLGDEIAADAWLKAGDDARALAAATRSGKPQLLAGTRLTIAERRLASGDTTGAQAMLRTAAAAPDASDAGTPFDRLAAARQRVRLIHLLARTGDVGEAERLASGYPGPGWRGFAYSAIVATTNRERAGAGWGGPFLDLPDVPADH